MKVQCPKCEATINIPDNKLPRNKRKAMIKCPKCKHSVVFDVPNFVEEEGDKTEIGDMADLKKKAKLINEATQEEFLLKLGKNIIGRKKEAVNVCIIGDGYIGRQHCMIEFKYTVWGAIELTLVDDTSLTGKQSTNGTFYQEQRLSEYDAFVLKAGDKIRVGRTNLRIVFF